MYSTTTRLQSHATAMWFYSLFVSIFGLIFGFDRDVQSTITFGSLLIITLLVGYLYIIKKREDDALKERRTEALETLGPSIRAFIFLIRTGKVGGVNFIRVPPPDITSHMYLDLLRTESSEIVNVIIQDLNEKFGGELSSKMLLLNSHMAHLVKQKVISPEEAAYILMTIYSCVQAASNRNHPRFKNLEAALRNFTLPPTVL